MKRDLRQRLLGLLALSVYAVPACGTAALIAIQHYGADKVHSGCCPHSTTGHEQDPARPHDPDHCAVCLPLLVWKSATPVQVDASLALLGDVRERALPAPAADPIAADVDWAIGPRAPPLT